MNKFFYYNHSNMDLLIFGATSNICAIRVFDNLNKLHNSIKNIYCYGSRSWSTEDFLIEHYKKKVKLSEVDKIKNKITYVKGKYLLGYYESLLSKLVNENTLIYVATPHTCYSDIIQFVNGTDKNCKLVLEKPLAVNYNEFSDIKSLFSKNIFMIDHFLYKQDVIDLIKNNKNRKFKSVRFQFNYTDDVEDRLGYFDNIGFFIDMFQSHFLGILYYLIGDEIKNLENLNIIRNIRKKYNGYGGKNNIDTYFYLEFEFNNVLYIFEAGKAMKVESKKIYLDNIEFKINNYHNEYELYFKDLFSNKIDSELIHLHEHFWKITDKVNKDFSSNCEIGNYIKGEF